MTFRINMLNSIHVSFLSPSTNMGPLRNHSKQTQLKENQKSQQKSLYSKRRQKKPTKINSLKEKTKTPPKVSSTKRWKERRKTKHQKELKTRLEANKKHIKNLSDKKLTNDQINLLAKGLKYISTPVKNEMQIKNNSFVTSIISREECVSNTFFTGKTQNLILSTLNLHGNHKYNHP